MTWEVDQNESPLLGQVSHHAHPHNLVASVAMNE